MKDVTVGVTGLIGFVIFTKGRKPSNVTPKDSSTVNMKFDEHGTLREVSVPKDVAALYLSDSIRTSLAKIVEPIRATNGEIESFRLEDGNESRVLVAPDQKDYFENLTCWDTQPEAIVSVEERVLLISSISFKEGHKWRFSDGETSFTASIIDKRSVKTTC